MKKCKSVLIIMTFMLLSICFKTNAASIPTIKYRAYIQTFGWRSYVTGGKTAGSTGKAKRLEGLQIRLKKNNKSMITYRVHVSKLGWMKWKQSGQLAGTMGQSKAIEAVKIKLNGTYAKKYDIYYRVHIRSKGWLGWAKNGATAGSTGLGVRTEAIQIKLVKKNAKVSGSKVSVLTKPSLKYKAHSQTYGWGSYVKEGATAGTTGKSKRLEALTITLKDIAGANGVKYRAHVAGVGWQAWKNSGTMAGTTGKGRAIEAVQIKLAGYNEKFFDIYYRMHVAKEGWLGWAKNGETAGTTGGGVRAEAIQIKIFVKDAPVNREREAYINYSDINKLYWPVRRNGSPIRTLTNHNNVNDHKGIDIGNAAGATWHAAYSGTIYKVFTGCWTNGRGDHSGCSPQNRVVINGKTVCNNGFGNGMIIRCVINGIVYYMQYAHMDRVAFTQADEGKSISKGTYLGTVGDRGYSFGIHAHFEVNQDKPFGPHVNNDPEQAGCIFQYKY